MGGAAWMKGSVGVSVKREGLRLNICGGGVSVCGRERRERR